MNTSFDDWLRHTLSANHHELEVMASIVLQRIASMNPTKDPAKLDGTTTPGKPSRRRPTGKPSPTTGKPPPEAIVTPPAN